MNSTHNYYMNEAIKEARKAQLMGEVPIGAVLVLKDEIIGRAHNLRENKQNSLAHAEILAINDACKRLGTWRLEDAILYVTLEPCPMCAGAIIQSRIKCVVYGANDPKGGCAGTFMNLLQDQRFNHQSETIQGVMEAECGALLTDFFRQLRDRKKQAKKRMDSGNNLQ